MQNSVKKKAILIILLVIIQNLLVTAIGIIRFGEKDNKTTCDVAIILGASTYNGEVSPVYRERLNHGIWLYENDYVDFLILTGGFGAGNRISDAAAAKKYVISMSVPEDIIYIEECSTITEENLKYAKSIMNEKSFDTAIVVSDPLHMKRAMLMAEDYNINAFSSPTPTTMYKTMKTKIPFLIREEIFFVGYSIVRKFR